MEEGGRHVHLGFEVEAEVGDEARDCHLCQSRLVSREFSYTGAFYKFVYPCIIDWRNIEGDDNSTILPFYSMLYYVQGMIVIGHLVDREHFIAQCIKITFPATGRTAVYTFQVCAAPQFLRRLMLHGTPKLQHPEPFCCTSEGSSQKAIDGKERRSSCSYQ
ncbi:hypothetical protein M9H77_12275 [Catharanthus roseus]|uniref:Uncharacterized protein n=1 Tax=Catharanthus roseus TaxID=4058 RepID=A0ACC0BGX0_CATRO|nr:hypothetical protein M9H77_12275 [Catharanthus roseus]